MAIGISGGVKVSRSIFEQWAANTSCISVTDDPNVIESGFATSGKVAFLPDSKAAIAMVAKKDVIGWPSKFNWGHSNSVLIH